MPFNRTPMSDTSTDKSWDLTWFSADGLIMLFLVVAGGKSYSFCRGCAPSCCQPEERAAQIILDWRVLWEPPMEPAAPDSDPAVFEVQLGPDTGVKFIRLSAARDALAGREHAPSQAHFDAFLHTVGNHVWSEDRSPTAQILQMMGRSSVKITQLVYRQLLWWVARVLDDLIALEFLQDQVLFVTQQTRLIRFDSGVFGSAPASFSCKVFSYCHCPCIRNIS